MKIKTIVLGLMALLAIGTVSLITPQAQQSPAPTSPVAPLPKKPVPQNTDAVSDAPVKTPSSTNTLSHSGVKQTDETTIIRTTDIEATRRAAAARGIHIRRASKPASAEAALVVLDVDPNSSEAAQIATAGGTIPQPNYRYEPAATANDPYYMQQWALTNMQVPSAWDITNGSSSGVLAVIDSGVLFSQTINGTTYSQPDLPINRQFTNSGEQGTTQSGDACWTGTPLQKSTNDCDDDNNGYIDDVHGWDFMGGFRGTSAACPNYANTSTYEEPGSGYLYADNDPQPYSCDSPSFPTILNKNHYNGTCETFVSACTVGHGTEVASVAAAQTDNSNLIAGIDQQTKIMSLRIFDGYGFTNSAHIAEAIDYAKNNGAKVINLSLAFNTCNGSFVDNTIEAALSSAKSAGVVIVAAAGNNNASNVCYPASSTNVIAVGASTSTDGRASFSSYGPQLELVAPGQDVLAATAPTSYLNSTLASVSGTSFSSPYVAAIANLILAVKPAATPDDVKTLLTERADFVKDMAGLSRTNQFGAGRANAYTSVRVASGNDRPVYKLRSFGGNTDIRTTSVVERNDFVDSQKASLLGIDFWDTGTNFAGSIKDYRDTQSGQ